MSDFSVFYSWQSDLPNATNRGFIGDALNKACKKVANNPDVEEAPRLDQDTQGLAGAPLIPQAIMDKIDSCQAFVADVSLCYRADDGTPSPNPNVAYELGYAVARLGWDRILLVINEEFGAIESLPFDLEKRRAMPYRAKEGEPDRSEAKKGLADRLATAIEAIAKQQPIVPKRSPADIAIEAIENQAPSRRARIRDFWTWVMTELRRNQPDLRSMEATSENAEKLIESLKEGLANSSEVVRAFSIVAEAIALQNDEEANEVFGRGFEELLFEYDHKEGYRGGISNSIWFDYWRFLGHELFTVRVASLLKEERWSLIDAALSKSFYWTRLENRTGQESASFDEFSAEVELLRVESKVKNRISVQADLLASRYDKEGIGASVSFKEFIDADFFLFLAAQFRIEKEYSYIYWAPWSTVYMREQPRFLVEASSSKVAASLKTIYDEADSENVRTVIKEKVKILREFWGFQWRSPLTTSTIDSFDTRK